MRYALFLIVCGLGIAVLIGCNVARRTPLPTVKAPTAGVHDVYEKVMFLPVWVPDGYQVVAGYFWATAHHKGVGSHIYLYSPRTGAVIEQVTRPDACPAAQALTKTEMQSVSRGEIVVKVRGRESCGWTKVGKVWIYAYTKAPSRALLEEIRKMLRGYYVRYHQGEAQEPSLRKQLAREHLGGLEVIARKYWDYVEFDNLVFPR